MLLSMHLYKRPRSCIASLRAPRTVLPGCRTSFLPCLWSGHKHTYHVGSPNGMRHFGAKAKKSQSGVSDTKGITVRKSEDPASWYTQAITKSEMIEYYDVSGCYILRPWSFFIWEQISSWLDIRIKRLGVRNAYFPLFVSEEALNAEKDHIEGFAPEVAWVTKSGSSDLAQPIAIRPTSETIMYPAFAKWIRSHRDLPLKLNQWTNIVRWEFKQPTPFLRTREFLWQEGHTVHASHQEAMAMVTQALDLYARVYEELLAIPVMKGVKSEHEKFAGGSQTTTIEAFVPANGRGIQAATSHLLGNNFARMFGISFEDESGQKQICEQTSWGFTTRSLGILVMVHGDDKGLVLPPRIAPTQVVIIPIPSKDETNAIEVACSGLCQQLKDAGIRVEMDDRPNYRPGWKYHWWEMKGVPLRLEIGQRDLNDGTCRMVRRDTGTATNVDQSNLSAEVLQELEIMQAAMLKKATEERDGRIVKVTEWSQVMPALERRNLILAPWCETEESEVQIKQATKEASLKSSNASSSNEGTAALSGAMKSLCIPFDQPAMEPDMKCFFTGLPAKRWALFGRSY